MTLTIFWLKVGVRRFLNLLKCSPVTVIWALIIAGSFIYAFVNNHIKFTLDTRSTVLAAALLVFFASAGSLKNHSVMPSLILRSKSKYRNNTIRAIFFVKHAIKNNLLLVAFIVFAASSLPGKIHLFSLAGASLVSMFFSFLIMSVKNSYSGRVIGKPEKMKPGISPLYKCTLYEYSPLVLTAVLCVMLCLFFAAIIIGEIFSDIEPESQRTFFYLLTVFFFIGFFGVIESVPNINWKFQAIVSPNDFKYHIKRTLRLFAGLFGPALVFFIIVGGIINLPLLLKHLYCILVLAITAINVAFTITHPLFKILIIVLVAALAIWISALPPGFLAVLLIPVFVTFVKAKSEYREWSLS